MIANFDMANQGILGYGYTLPNGKTVFGDNTAAQIAKIDPAYAALFQNTSASVASAKYKASPYPTATLSAQTMNPDAIAASANTLLAGQGYATTAAGRTADASRQAQSAADASNASWDSSMSSIYGNWWSLLTNQEKDANSLRTLGRTLMAGQLPKSVIDQLVKQQGALNLSSGVYGGAANSATLSSLGINVMNSMITGAGLVNQAASISGNMLGEAVAMQNSKAKASDFFSPIYTDSVNAASSALNMAGQISQFNAEQLGNTALSNLNNAVSKWQAETSVGLFNLTRADNIANANKNTGMLGSSSTSSGSTTSSSGSKTSANAGTYRALTPATPPASWNDPTWYQF